MMWHGLSRSEKLILFAFPGSCDSNVNSMLINAMRSWTDLHPYQIYVIPLEQQSQFDQALLN